MTDIRKLKKKLLVLIKDDHYDVNALKKFLNLDSYVTNESFVTNITEIVDAILEDRDGDKKITLNDIKLIGNDLLAITSIIKGLLLIVNSIPNLKLKYDTGKTEELIFKMLVYIFLVIMPKQAHLQWSVKEKAQMIDIALIIYDTIKSSQVVKEMVAKVLKWFKENGGTAVVWMKKNCCASNGQDKNEIIKKHLPHVKAKIRMRVSNVRDKCLMDSMAAKIQALEKELNEYEFFEE